MPKQRVQEVAKKMGWISAMDIVRNAKIGTTTAYAIWNDEDYLPSIPILTRIAQALGVSFKDLLLDDISAPAQDIKTSEEDKGD